jgi:hypothetical protein
MGKAKAAADREQPANIRHFSDRPGARWRHL